MKEMISRLMRMESIARDLYAAASEYSQDDKDFSTFLKLLADDESHHYNYLTHAVDFLTENKLEISPAVLLDEKTQEELESRLVQTMGKVESGDISKNEILTCIVAVESSEWNGFFLFIVSTLKALGKDFQASASSIEHHKTRILNYLDTLPDVQEHLDRMQSVPSVWRGTILVVEDSDAIADLLKILLEDEFSVEIAGNGEEGYHKASAKHYDVLISDLAMPIMDGIEFYRKLTEVEPEIGKRFLFYTGSITLDSERFFMENGLRFLEKPAPINLIRETVRGIANSRSQRRRDVA